MCETQLYLSRSWSIIWTIAIIFIFNCIFVCSILSVSCYFFFFSSRRRHTRFDCDWSSDVCSSDLRISAVTAEQTPHVHFIGLAFQPLEESAHAVPAIVLGQLFHVRVLVTGLTVKIGRASCRERV